MVFGVVTVVAVVTARKQYIGLFRRAINADICLRQWILARLPDGIGIFVPKIQILVNLEGLGRGKFWYI
jgi:hypothetical protein